MSSQSCVRSTSIINLAAVFCLLFAASCKRDTHSSPRGDESPMDQPDADLGEIPVSNSDDSGESEPFEPPLANSTESEEGATEPNAETDGGGLGPDAKSETSGTGEAMSSDAAAEPTQTPVLHDGSVPNDSSEASTDVAIVDAGNESTVAPPDPPVFPEGPPLVLVLIDASSGVFSVQFDFGGSPPFGEHPDVWEAMRQALSLLADFEDITYWPMTYGAERDGATCPQLRYPLAPLAGANELAAFLPVNSEAVSPTKQEGPLFDALAVAYAELLAFEHAGPKHLLVLTDGPPGDTCTTFDAPLCGTDAVYGAAQEAFANGIRTRIINFGGENGLVFAENLAHAGAGEPVVPVPMDELFCLSNEAQERGVTIANATAFYEGEYRNYTLAEYGPDGYVYAEELAGDPFDTASLQSAVVTYAAFLVTN